MMCAQLPLDSQVWPSLAIAGLSSTGDFAACMSCLLCRGLFSCGPTVFVVHNHDAWVQQRCSAGRMMCAQLPPDSQMWWRWQCRIKLDRDFLVVSMSGLLCRGLFSCGPTVFVHDSDAWVQQRCSAGRVPCAQLLHQVYRALGDMSRAQHTRRLARRLTLHSPSVPGVHPPGGAIAHGAARCVATVAAALLLCCSAARSCTCSSLHPLFCI